MGMFDSGGWQRASMINRKAVKLAKNKRKKQAKRAKKALREFSLKNPPAYRLGMPAQLFYLTREWRSVRWQILSASDGTCCMCGATATSSGRPMHVDHAVPRSKSPGRELDQTNLQVLCEDCNLGKGAQHWSKLAVARV